MQYSIYRADEIESNNLEPTPQDLLWYDPKAEEGEGVGLEKDKYYTGAKIVSMREEFGKDTAAWLAFRGGSSNQAHDHLDVGGFVYTIGGVRWAVDIGKEPYSYLTDENNPSIQAGYDSKYFYRRKGEGHNIVVINPDDKLETDINAKAEIERYEFGENSAYAILDMTKLYDDVTEYKRGFMLTDSRRSLIVRDEINLKSQSELYWFMTTRAEIEIVDNTTAILIEDGKRLKVEIKTNAPDAELSIMAAELLPTSPQFNNSPNSEYSKLALKVSASGEVNITAKMYLEDENIGWSDAGSLESW